MAEEAKASKAFVFQYPYGIRHYFHRILAALALGGGVCAQGLQHDFAGMPARDSTGCFQGCHSGSALD